MSIVSHLKTEIHITFGDELVAHNHGFVGIASCVLSIKYRFRIWQYSLQYVVKFLAYSLIGLLNIGE